MEAIRRLLDNRKIAGRYLIVAALLPVWAYVLYHLRLPILTRSIEPVAVWVQHDPEPDRKIKTGEYVTFDQYAPKPYNKVMTLIKRVGCGGGDALTVDRNDHYYCNGTYLAMAKKEVAGKAITPFRFNGRVPAGKLFLVGDFPGSYDSRVYGFVDRDRIKGVAWPLL